MHDSESETFVLKTVPEKFSDSTDRWVGLGERVSSFAKLLPDMLPPARQRCGGVA